jgi:mono/diheme cytochrome c family protein
MKFLAGFVFAFILMPVFVYGYFKLGFAPVATASAPWPFEMRLAHMALDARISKEAPKEPLFQPSEADMQEGARLYRADCAACHGLPGQPKTHIATGMYPDPPELFKGKGVTDDPAGETYWKVSNGIRLTGMPSYSKTTSEKQMWEVSILVATADKLPASVMEILRKPVTDN